MTPDALRCAGPGCEMVLTHVRTAGGQRQRFCSARCRGRSYALAHPRAPRAAILAPGYVALPASTIVAPGQPHAVQAGELAAACTAAMTPLVPPCQPISQMLSASLEARLAELEA